MSDVMLFGVLKMPYELAMCDELSKMQFYQRVQELIGKYEKLLAELDKQGEPVGRFYWESVVDGHVMAVPSEGTPHYNKDDFPLYTTPQTKQCKDCGEINPAEIHTCSPQTKPLSDEEIIELCQRIGLDFGSYYIHEFARAIEERILGNGRYRSK